MFAAMRLASSRLSNFRRRSPARLIFEIDIGERLTVVVAHDETRGLFLDGPRRREAGEPSVLRKALRCEAAWPDSSSK